ncbi:Protein kinase domain-containing protein, partial [Meloidogyne graminicola]
IQVIPFKPLRSFFSLLKNTLSFGSYLTLYFSNYTTNNLSFGLFFTSAAIHSKNTIFFGPPFISTPIYSNNTIFFAHLTTTQKTTSILDHTSPQLQTTQETLQESDEDQVLTWDDFSKFQCYRKLGEGDYGEVYGVACDGAELALKVIPINEHNSAENVSTEIFITRQLSALRDEGYSFVTSRFIRLIRAAVVKGAYPENLLTAWDKYRQEKGEAIALNHRPECNMNNTYGLLLMENGGTDLEAYLAEENVDPSQCFSIFYQVALSIAIAEKRCEFEHRDLHIGNILIFKIEEKGRNTAKKCSDDGIRFLIVLKKY